MQVHHPCTILLAEDDSDDRILFQEAIDTLDKEFKIIEVENGQQTLDLLRNADQLPDIVVLDINMPLIQGTTCVRMIREDKRLAKLPIIIMSTSTNEATIAEAKRAGATRYAIKPAIFSELQAVIEYMCMTDWSQDNGEDFILNEAVKKH